MQVLLYASAMLDMTRGASQATTAAQPHVQRPAEAAAAAAGLVDPPQPPPSSPEPPLAVPSSGPAAGLAQDHGTHAQAEQEFAELLQAAGEELHEAGAQSHVWEMQRHAASCQAGADIDSLPQADGCSLCGFRTRAAEAVSDQPAAVAAPCTAASHTLTRPLDYYDLVKLCAEFDLKQCSCTFMLTVFCAGLPPGPHCADDEEALPSSTSASATHPLLQSVPDDVLLSTLLQASFRPPQTQQS